MTIYAAHAPSLRHNSRRQQSESDAGVNEGKLMYRTMNARPENKDVRRNTVPYVTVGYVSASADGDRSFVQGVWGVLRLASCTPHVIHPGTFTVTQPLA
jgi:hypothetical protein